MQTHDSPALLRRFWSKVAVAGPDDCWLWTASTRKGRGQFHLNGQLIEAPRVALILTIGDSPLLSLHVCDNGLCCNPSHLYWGTSKQNTQDMMRRGRHRPPARKLTREQLVAARAMVRSGRTLKDVAAYFGMSPDRLSERIKGMDAHAL